MPADEQHAPRPGAEALAEPLRSRWSPSVFDPHHDLSSADVEVLLRAAQWAPSAGNSQPWRYLVAPRGSAAHDLLVPTLSRGNAGWVPRASLVLLAGVQVAPDPHDPDGPYGSAPKSVDHARHDLGQASAHITLQARAMGLHTHQFAGFDRPAACAALGVPSYVELMTGIAVGVPLAESADEGLAAGDDLIESDRARERRGRERRLLGEIAFCGRWGEPWTT
mgnify:CR=1 FL=1